LAVLITVFCFIFPNAFGNAKASVGRARDWALPKIDAGINFGLELPSLGMNGVKIGGSFLAHPFNWMWSFLSCVGKCFGLGIPKFNISLPKWIGIPKFNISLPIWMTCTFNCFKREE